MKPENGFIDHDSFTIMVKIEIGVICEYISNIENGAIDGTTCDKEHLKWECPICLEDFNDKHPFSTLCGHLCCFECIIKAFKDRQVYPTCKAAAKSDNLRRIFIPT